MRRRYAASSPQCRPTPSTVRVLFDRYGSKVKYWLTFNEINSVLHEPFMSGGIGTPKEELSPADLYQAVHHELGVPGFYGFEAIT